MDLTTGPNATGLGGQEVKWAGQAHPSLCTQMPTPWGVWAKTLGRRHSL